MIILVGAGPSGLATAYYLQKRGLPYRILEKERVGYAWCNHYDRLQLHTLKQVSALPGKAMPRGYPNFISKDQFLAYLEDYAHHFQLPIESGIKVERAEDTGTEWILHTNQGQIKGQILIAATGIWSNPVRPKFSGEETFGGSIRHALTYRNAAPYQGQRVLVIGAGNTGTEIAVDLAEHGVESAIAIRSGTTFIPYPNSATLVQVAAWVLRTLPKFQGEQLLRKMRVSFQEIGINPPSEPLMDAYPVVGYALPEAVAVGQVALYGDIDHLYPGGVHFTDDQKVSFDSIILATGYRPTTHFITPYFKFASNGWPILRQGRSTLNPRLFCVGFEYPATEGFLQSVGRAARQVVVQM